MLLLSQDQDISLEEVLKYPLTPVPLSLAHLNGSLCATNKASLVHKLEAMVQHLRTPPMVDVVIIDVMFLIRSQVSFLPVHYGDVARYLLKTVKAFGAKMVFLVCDVYSIETIKDTCREERGTITGGTYPDKLGPAQSRPRDFANMLKHDSFKNAFFKFLIDE
ncbi:hypothetical protein WMY93_018110 [Mugilogobius chulae]|uniref:Uncharacterized protein n=1 Tax=Mugilogobius chulae TaxID=88201 RepID=A0AAW0NI65_9GOBI